MRTYIIPPTIKDEREKVIGGVLDMVQAGWIMGGAVVGVVIFLLLAPVSKILGAVVGIPVAVAISVIFGFLKIKGYSVLKYAKYKKQFNDKQKLLPNKRDFK